MLEFNELAPALLDRFCAAGVLPNFARFRAESEVALTMAPEREPFLEPWIQWVTVHTGVDFAEHQIFHLNEGQKLRYPQIWDLLADDARIIICGSMNPSPSKVNGVLIPDPWCTEVNPTPSELLPYFEFVQRNVLEHTNDQAPLRRSDYGRFGKFMLSHGLSVQTISVILKQLREERRVDTRWKRVVLLDRLQFDVFSHYYRRLTPHFATFFLNSTAHYQHAYWDRMDPAAFGADYHPDDEQKYKHAIQFGYECMDRLLGKFMELAGPETTLILCTALSQEPWTNYEAAGVAAFYRPKNFEQLASLLKFEGRHKITPVMTQQFFVEFGDERDAIAAERSLRGISVEGRAAIGTKREGARVFAGCQLVGEVAQNAAMMLASGVQLPFFDVFYRMDTSKTGMHHPEGIFWCRGPRRVHRVVADPIPLAAVAPTVLSLLGVAPPEHMTHSALGLS